MKRFFNLVFISISATSLFLMFALSRFISFDQDGVWLSSYGLWGDWSAHLSYTQFFFTHGIRAIWMDNPLMAGAPLQYPFLSHLITATLAKIFDLSPMSLLYMTSFVLLGVLPFNLYRFFKKIGLSDLYAVSSVFTFLFIGGFQWLFFDLSLDHMLSTQMEQGSYFTQFTLTQFMPQRAFLFGLNAFLILIPSLLQNLKVFSLKSIGFAALLSLVSILHLHTFLCMSVLVLIWALVPFSREKFKFGFTLLLLSLVLLKLTLFYRSMPPELNAHFAIWNPGWALSEASVRENFNLLLFWFLNTGLFLPISAFGVHQTWNFPIIRLFSIAGTVLFLLGNLFQFQPYIYDNLKVFTYAFLFLMPAFSFGLFSFKKPQKLVGKVVLTCAVLCVLLTHSFTAIHDYVALFKGAERVLWYSNEDFELAKRFKTLCSDPSERVLTYGRHNHWVPGLTGSPTVMGYTGWLWSWGMAFRKREQEIAMFLGGKQPPYELLNQLKIKWIVVNTQEKIMNQTPNVEFLKANFKLSLESGNWLVFRVQD